MACISCVYVRGVRTQAHTEAPLYWPLRIRLTCTTVYA